VPHIVGRNTAKTSIGEAEEDMVKSSTKSISE